VLGEIEDHINSLSGESVIHYLLWSLMALVMIMELCLFSPSVIGYPNKNNIPQQEFVEQDAVEQEFVE
jgi:hypothetical protein